ncbi:Adhesion defective protein 1 [Tolypocladium paradoxum]|uniref:Adhesion defective protein 1 n=1 Tax=Tolypocladium paradoxum TaxID=94208 RepID=A0A2S4KP42_9HYPO|nr:Adhesion defective protein 1 [Tolypocladium paradoxum]
MATSMGPNFTGHPAAMGHQAVAGHPMGPGMPPNAGQQGAPGGGMPQQFGGAHMAVSGPGGQVNPALMGAMPPGVNPHLQHLSPTQQQLYQQQHQQQLQNQCMAPSAPPAVPSSYLTDVTSSAVHNPSAMAAMRQHQLLQHQQHQARQALLHQQSLHPGMVGNGIPMGMPLNQLNAQQMQQLRQAGRIGPGQHPQAQVIMANQLALQQQQQQQQAVQQAAHNQQMAGGPNQGQPMPMNAQNMASVQQQNQMGGAGGQNQMGGQQQGGQQAQGQPQAQPQVQPQQPGQQAQQTPQQSSQAGTPAPSGQLTPSQTPAPAPAQSNQLQQGQGQPQPQQMHPQAQHQMTAVAAAQQMAMTNSLFQQQRREGMKGQCLLKLMQFSEHLSGFPGAKGKDDLSYWNTFVARFFAPNGVFRHSVHISDAEDTMDKQYEIAYPAIARYFHTHFGSGVKSMQLIMDKGVTDRLLPGDCQFIENSRASLVYWFETGSHLVATGILRAQFDAEQRLELFEFLTTGHEEYISRKQVIDAAKPAHMWFKEWHKLNSQDGKQSPEMTKKSKAKPLKSPPSQPPEVLVDLPDSAVNSKGVTEAVHQFLEIVEVMGQMNPLFGYCHGNPGVGPYLALEQYVSTYINGAPPAMNGQAMPQGPRTPGFGQFPMGASPAMAHMNLPGSPHIGSPGPGQMQAPGMQLQPSQQGTSSSGPSANTSPASNKRRRPSGVVKTEDDGSGAPTPAGSGPQVNGVQNRATKPPTPRMPKRVKGNPS